MNTTEPTTGLSEPRFLREPGLEARVADVVDTVAPTLGFRLVRIKISALNGQTVQIMAERADGTMAIEDCEALSKALSPEMDIADPVPGAYNLEVSSPGIDRPLVRRSDFTAWAGYAAKCTTERIVDGRKRFKGVIVGIDGDKVRFRSEAADDEKETEFVLGIDNIAEARLVLTDELVREALRRDKKSRRANAGKQKTDPPSANA